MSDKFDDGLFEELYLSGKKLYGDDFGPRQLQEWYEKEREGYFGLVKGRQQPYEYHALNIWHGFRHVELPNASRAMCIGGSTCEELLPVCDRLVEIVNVEPASGFEREALEGVPVRRVEPHYSGRLPFADETFDLITCFGSLHHIPNVSFVLRECARCLKVGGYLLVREPVVSMGDWRRPRPRLTANERGIPLPLFHDMIAEAGLTVRNEALCLFAPLVAALHRLGIKVSSHSSTVLLDAILSRLFKFNLRYHWQHLWHKFAPSAVFFTLVKRG